MARDCPRRRAGWKADGGVQKVRGELKCFTCGQKGHVAMRCPLFCKGQQKAFEESGGWLLWYGGVSRRASGRKASSRYFAGYGVFKNLGVSGFGTPGKMKEGEVAIRCACGDTIKYPLAEVEISVGGRQISVEAEASETLPTVQGKQVEKALVVETRAQARLRERKAAVEKIKEMTSTAKPKAVEVLPEGEEADGENAECTEYDFDEEIFQGGRERCALTRRQKRQERRHHFQEKQASEKRGEGELTMEELQKLQQVDSTLEVPRKLAEEGDDSSGEGFFFYRDGLLFRRWIPKEPGGDDRVVKQLVLPSACRVAVMKLAHSIPMAGHMGKMKSTRRIMERFYWPTLYREVADFCRGCQDCQRSSQYRGQKAPLIPLPIMSAPFEHIAMAHWSFCPHPPTSCWHDGRAPTRWLDVVEK